MTIDPEEIEENFDDNSEESTEDIIEDSIEDAVEEPVEKELYDYQKQAITDILKLLEEKPAKYNVVFQLPTGGGKTVIFSEIARRFIQERKKKVVILTHRIELCVQTSRILSEFNVKSKIIESKVKELPDQHEYMCFVAMVETLNNRLKDQKFIFEEVGLVIIDEAHYNSFKKIFKYFENCNILGVTATPLSSNIKLPMKDNYNELIVGDTISTLIGKSYLAKATTYCYDVSLGTLKVGINGDYTVSSSDILYSSYNMLEKLLYAYEEKAKGKKTLIFNNGISTSQQVYYYFKAKDYNIRHLDNKTSKQERKEIIEWFKATPDAILTSVTLLTTGFDEPTVETIILNRATKSLTLYFQMIGRGSRILPNKPTFDVIDLGNNAARFGSWDGPINWQDIFLFPDNYYESLLSDEEIERNFKYTLPPELREKFSKSVLEEFNIQEEYSQVLKQGLRSKAVLEKSIEQHARICIENSQDVFEARDLAKLLDKDIEQRVRQYSYCICKSTENYIKWLKEDYELKLRMAIGKIYSSMASAETSETENN